jgi:hypothetical protein
LSLVAPCGRLLLGGILTAAGIFDAHGPAAAAMLSALTWTLAIGLLATYLSFTYRFFAGPQDLEALRGEFS